MNFSELKPRLTPDGGEYRQLSFDCPRCQSHRVMIDVWPHAPGEKRLKVNGPQVQDFYEVKRLWHFEQAGESWDSVTLSPSINRAELNPPDLCGGWHGIVRNGQVS